MTITKGTSLLGLLGGLLDSDSSTELATAIREVLAFANADHRWSVDVRVKHDPKRADDD